MDKENNISFKGISSNLEDMEKFLDQLPCAIFRCLNNDFYTIQFANYNFFELTGYSSNEIKELFNNNYTELIFKNDSEKLIRDINSQLKKSDTYEVEYRIVHKNGSILWVKDKGNKIISNDVEIFYCSISDITDEKINGEKYEINQKYYRTIVEKSGECMYVIETDENKISYSNNLIAKFGSKVLKYKNIYEILDSDFIYSDDILLCNDIINEVTNVNNEENYDQIEIRIKSKQGEYIWCLIKFYLLRDVNKKIKKVIGVITDIDEAKKEHRNLHIMAETDMLTGIYNKITSQKLIEEYISEENTKGALFIIDLDNFKSINDNLGHLFGDGVLTEVASEIKSLVKKDDIVGRIGGDEFIVFMKDIESNYTVIKKAETLQRVLNRSYKGNDNGYRISGSVGISIYPSNGKDFKEIFKKADIASYYCKQKGKNCYQLYNDNIAEVKYISTRNQFSEIDSEKTREDNFPKYIFEILYETKHIDVAMDRILSLTARYYNIDHIYIFEYIEEVDKLEKTYEYCKKGKNFPYKNALIYDYLEYNKYINLYDINGVFYCNDIENLPENIRSVYKKFNIYSVLQSIIMDEDKFKGVIGFSEGSRKRLWSQVEIDASIFISKIISIFLLKKRKEKQLIKLNSLFQFMLEKTTTCNYIVDKETRDIIYVNENTKYYYRHAKVGEKCYKTIRGNSNICDDCPANRLVNGIRRAETNIYNEENNIYLNGVMLLAKWIDNREVYIILQSIDKKK